MIMLSRNLPKGWTNMRRKAGPSSHVLLLLLLLLLLPDFEGIRAEACNSADRPQGWDRMRSAHHHGGVRGRHVPHAHHQCRRL